MLLLQCPGKRQTETGLGREKCTDCKCILKKMFQNLWIKELDVVGEGKWIIKNDTLWFWIKQLDGELFKEEDEPGEREKHLWAEKKIKQKTRRVASYVVSRKLAKVNLFRKGTFHITCWKVYIKYNYQLVWQYG